MWNGPQVRTWRIKHSNAVEIGQVIIEQLGKIRLPQTWTAECENLCYLRSMVGGEGFE